MKFDEFWSKLQKIDELSLETIKQKREFTATFERGHNLVKIIPPSGKPRPISRDQFSKIWNVAKNTVNPYRPSNYSDMTRNSSYAVVLIKYILRNEKIE